MGEFIELERKSEVSATLWLKRPEVKNAFDDQLVQQLLEVLEDLAQDPMLRLVILRGRGSHFSAGADLNWMKKAANYTHEENFADALTLAKLMTTLDQFPHPTIVYAHGGAFGGALGLIACCDIVLADPKTLFSLSEVRLGLVPAVISPYVVRSIGFHQARRYFLTAERFDGVQAKELGLVHELVDEAHVQSRFDYFTDEILKGGPQAINSTKAMLHNLESEGLEEKTYLTAQLIAEVRAGDEAQEGLDCFLEKVSPPWVSRKNDV